VTIFHEEGKRVKGKGEREEIIGRGLRPLPIINLLYEGASNPYRAKRKKKSLCVF
jgi:hypothetical protein